MGSSCASRLLELPGFYNSWPILVGLFSCQGAAKVELHTLRRSFAVEGIAGSPGMVEGIARVVLAEDEFDKVQPGSAAMQRFSRRCPSMAAN